MPKDELIQQLVDALAAAQSHLEYCGYGDNWERECAREAKLEEQIEAALTSAKQVGFIAKENNDGQI